MIKFRCTQCSKGIGVDEKHAGKQVKCPQCQTQLEIPTLDPPVVEMVQDPLDPFGSLSAPGTISSNPYSSAPPTGTANDSLGASPLATPKKLKPSTDTSEAPPSRKPTSIGVSFAGLAAASLVAFFCTVVWLMIAAVTGKEFGILAWAIGGLIGLIAGSIAKNPSPVFCGLAASVAAMSILGAN